MKKRHSLFLLAFLVGFAVEAQSIRYKVHEQSKGWHPWVKGGTTVGSEDKRIEAIKILPFNFPNNATIEYRVHVQSKGWMSWKKAGEVAGTTGLSLRMEAIEIRLINFPGQSICYNVFCGYRENCTSPCNKGWSEACDGKLAGTVGRRKPIEKIKIWLTPD